MLVKAKKTFVRHGGYCAAVGAVKRLLASDDSSGRCLNEVAVLPGMLNRFYLMFLRAPAIQPCNGIQSEGSTLG